MPIPGPELPVARVHVSGRWLRMFAIAMILPVTVALCMSFGTLLDRIDQANAAANVARTESLQLRAALIDHARQTRAALATVPAVDPVCRRNTEALRGGLMALVRTGAFSMPNDPGSAWVEWRAEDSKGD